MGSSMSVLNGGGGEDAFETYRHLNLDQDSRVQATYIWIDGSGETLRAKTRTLDSEPSVASDLPKWMFDGSSCAQATTQHSDVVLRPVALFADPLLGGKNKLVLCTACDADCAPLPSNKRSECAKVMAAAAEQQPWFGMEQEYMLFDVNGDRPLGWQSDVMPATEGKSYCGMGAGNVFGRDIVESHYRACLHAGIKLAGTNAEVTVSQWEFQVGPCEGIDMGDELWAARFLLHRVAEPLGVRVNFDPKPVADVNGSGMHTNFSTLRMRQPGGIEAINEAVEQLRGKHVEHMAVYGAGNERRLTGTHETAPMDVFSAGVGDRGASIRIPLHAHQDGCGYLEDRRPASNADPYQVSRVIVHTCCL